MWRSHRASILPLLSPSLLQCLRKVSSGLRLVAVVVVVVVFALLASLQHLKFILRRTWGDDEISYERSLGEKKIAERKDGVVVELKKGPRRRSLPWGREAEECLGHGFREVASELSDYVDSGS